MLISNLKLLADFWTAFLRGGESGPRFSLVVILFVLISSGLLVVLFISKIQQDTIDLASVLSVIPMAGILLVIFISYPLFLVSAWFARDVNFRLIFLSLSILITVSAFLAHPFRKWPSSHSMRSALILIAVFVGFLILRLPFYHDLVLPTYSDSVEHYQIINDLLHPELSPQAFYKLERLVSRYYHFGFHMLAAWLGVVSGTTIQDTMLALGQILQAIVPLSLFFPVKSMTKSNIAGLMAVLFLGICWRMPSFASNWGKYPALTGLAVFPFLPGILYLADSAINQKKKLILILIAIIGGVLTVLCHTRYLILMVMAIGGWWMAGQLLNGRAGLRSLALFVSLLLMLGAIYLVSTDKHLTVIFTPYWEDGYLPTLVVVLLIPWGLKVFPRLMTAVLFCLLFIISGSVLPFPQSFTYFGYQYLIDRPFVQVVLALPLSVIGGVGFAGLVSFVANRSRDWKVRWKQGLLIVLYLVPVVLILNALSLYELSPSSCCQLVGRDDLAAYRWIEMYLPKDAVILIAGNRTQSRNFGVDGGVWIAPLSGYKTKMRPNATAFSSPETVEELCKDGVTHIYAGGSASRFSVEQLYKNPSWYRNLYASPGAYLFEVICP